MRCCEREVRIIRFGVLREEQRARSRRRLYTWLAATAGSASTVLRGASLLSTWRIQSRIEFVWFLLNAETKFER
jgi:hypothetical protein